MPHGVKADLAVAVLIPCYNEEQTIGDVVQRFRETLPSASIYVYDNNSSDLTALKARAAGAIVVREPRQGKGNVVRRMFADIDADVYLMADGDGTYAPEDAPQLINTLLTERIRHGGRARGAASPTTPAGPATPSATASSTASTSGCSAATSPTSFPATAPSRGASSRASRRSPAASRSRPRCRCTPRS